MLKTNGKKYKSKLFLEVKNMPKFDTDVQELKYKVLKEVARATFEGTLLEEFKVNKNIDPFITFLKEQQ